MSPISGLGASAAQAPLSPPPPAAPQESAAQEAAEAKPIPSANAAVGKSLDVTA